MSQKRSAACQVSSVVDDSVSYGWKLQKGDGPLFCCFSFLFSCHTTFYLCCPRSCQFLCSTGYFQIPLTLYETPFQFLINPQCAPCVYLRNSIKPGIEKVSSTCQWLLFANWKNYGCFQNKNKFIDIFILQLLHFQKIKKQVVLSTFVLAMFRRDINGSYYCLMPSNY